MVGVDVAFKWDTTAAVPLWVRDLEHRQFGPAEVLVPPRDGTSMDPDLIKQAIERIHLRNPISAVVMDTHNAEDVAAWIERELEITVLDTARWRRGIRAAHAVPAQRGRAGPARD
jgi:hypothetical protein